MIEAVYRSQGYYIDIENICRDKSDELSAKFDTGATATVFSFATVHPNIPEYAAKKIFTQIENNPNSYAIKTFQSASGQDMTCVKCTGANVRIGGVSVNKFHYWLYLNNETTRALIGDDFIRFCTFSHAPLGNIVINAFDKSGYLDFYEQKVGKHNDNALSEADIVGLINEKLKYEERVISYNAALSKQHRTNVYCIVVDNNSVNFSERKIRHSAKGDLVYWHKGVPYKLIYGKSSNLTTKQRKYLFGK